MLSAPLAWRVVLVVAVIEAGVLGLSALALLDNARRAVAVEVAASQGLARDYVIAAVGSLIRDNDPETVMQFLPGMLYQPRHVRITIEDRRRGVLHAPTPPHAGRASPAPAWFRRLLTPPVKELRLPIQVAARVYGDVMIAADPDDEISEVWNDFRALIGIGSTAYVLTLALLGFVVTRALRPLKTMTEACARLQHGDYAARIGSISTPELTALARQIDQLGGALKQTMSEKDALNRRLQAARDDERKAIALELHDEFGPCLFGLSVEARSVVQTAEARGETALVQSGGAMLDIVEQMRRTNRRLLERLRPMEMDQFPLAQVLDALVARMAEIGGDIDWRVSIDPGLGDYDESSALAIYRITQEALTNCLRHAEAKTVSVRIRRAFGAAESVLVEIEDDGRGFPDGASNAPGRHAGAGADIVSVGLMGMRERAESLGGRFVAATGPMGGAAIRASIPISYRAALQEAS